MSRSDRSDPIPPEQNNPHARLRRKSPRNIIPRAFFPPLSVAGLFNSTTSGGYATTTTTTETATETTTQTEADEDETSSDDEEEDENGLMQETPVNHLEIEEEEEDSLGFNSDWSSPKSATSGSRSSPSTAKSKSRTAPFVPPPPPPEFAYFNENCSKSRFRSRSRSKSRQSRRRLLDELNANITLKKYSSGGFDISQKSPSEVDLMKMLNAANNNEDVEIEAFPLKSTQSSGKDAASSSGKSNKSKVSGKSVDSSGKVHFSQGVKPDTNHNKLLDRRQTGPAVFRASIEEDDDEEGGSGSVPGSANENSGEDSGDSKSKKSGLYGSGKGSNRPGSMKSDAAGSVKSEGSAKSGSAKSGSAKSGSAKSGSAKSDKTGQSEADAGSRRSSSAKSREGSQKGSDSKSQGQKNQQEDKAAEPRVEDGGPAPPDNPQQNNNPFCCVDGCIQAQLVDCYPMCVPSCCCNRFRRNRCPQKCGCCCPKYPCFKPCSCQRCRVYHYCFNVINRTQIKAEDMFLGIHTYEAEIKRQNYQQDQQPRPYLKGPIVYNNVGPGEFQDQCPEEDPNQNVDDEMGKAQNWPDAPEGYGEGGGGQGQVGAPQKIGAQSCGKNNKFPCRINPWLTEYAAQFKDHSDKMRRTTSRYPASENNCWMNCRF